MKKMDIDMNAMKAEAEAASAGQQQVVELKSATEQATAKRRQTLAKAREELDNDSAGTNRGFKLRKTESLE